MTEYVLWGQKYVPVPIKITGGTATHCRRELRHRVREGGWADLAVLPKGERPAVNDAAVALAEGSVHRAWCVEHEHPGTTYNPICDLTWCACGEVITAGDTSSHILCCLPMEPTT